MGSGKSTVADYLSNTYKYTKFALGAKIHSECQLYNMHDRHHLQEYGQAMRQVFGINIWCDYLYNQSISINKIVIEDGRQLNEYDYFVNLGYLPVGIKAKNSKKIERLKKRVSYPIDLATFQHDTEIQAKTAVNKCKIIINNNSDDLEVLYKEIEDKLGKYLKI
jgi:dephospho-CoA kinase